MYKPELQTYFMVLKFHALQNAKHASTRKDTELDQSLFPVPFSCTIVSFLDNESV